MVEELALVVAATGGGRSLKGREGSAKIAMSGISQNKSIVKQ